MARYAHSKTKQGGPDRLMVTFCPLPNGGYSIKKNGATAVLDDFTAILDATLPRNIEAVVADSDDESSISVDSVDGDVGDGYSNGYFGLLDEDAGSFDGDVDQYSSSVIQSSAVGSSLDNPVDLVDDDEDSFAGVEDAASHLSMHGTSLVDGSASGSSTAESYVADILLNSRDEATSGVAPDAPDDLSDVDNIPSSDFPAVDSVDSRVGTPFGNSLNASDNLSGVDSIPSFDFALTDSADEALSDNFSSGSSVTLDNDDTTHQEIDAIDAERMAANKAHGEITRNLLDEASQLTREKNSLRESAAYQKQLCDAAVASEAKCRAAWGERERLSDEASTCLMSAAIMIVENSGPNDAIREAVPLIHLAVHGNLKLGGTGGDLVAAVAMTREHMKLIREKRFEEAEQGAPGGAKRPAGNDQVQREAKVRRCSGCAWEERKTPERFGDLCLSKMRAKEDRDGEDVFEDALEIQ